MAEAVERRDRDGSLWARAWPLGLLLLAALLAWGLGLHRALSLEALAGARGRLLELVAARPLLTAGLYAAAYVAIVALSVPVGPLLTMTGGLLFGHWLGLAIVVPAATLGACLLFLAMRSAFAGAVARRAGPLVERLRPGLERDGFWYLLAIRLLPVVPFTLGSIAPALVGMRLPVFAAATAVGILPGSAVFAGLGAGLDGVVARGAAPDLADLLAAPVLLPLLGLAALSLGAVWWRHRREA